MVSPGSHSQLGTGLCPQTRASGSPRAQSCYYECDGETEGIIITIKHLLSFYYILYQPLPEGQRY